MALADLIRAEISRLRDEYAQVTAEVGQLDAERQTLTERLEALVTEREQAARRALDLEDERKAAERALAVAEDHAPVPTIDVPAVPPVDPNRLDPHDIGTATRTPDEADAAERRTGRYAKDPTVVHPRGGGNRASAKKSTPVPAHEVTEVDARMDSPTTRERADLLEMVIGDAVSMNQYAMATAMGELLGCERGTAQTITSLCLRLLCAENRARFTGEKVPPTEGGRATSPVYRLTTPHERASAGLSVDDDNFAGKTTRQPDQAPWKVESSAFEQGKGR